MIWKSPFGNLIIHCFTDRVNVEVRASHLETSKVRQMIIPFDMFSVHIAVINDAIVLHIRHRQVQYVGCLLHMLVCMIKSSYYIIDILLTCMYYDNFIVQYSTSSWLLCGNVSSVSNDMKDMIYIHIQGLSSHINLMSLGGAFFFILGMSAPGNNMITSWYGNAFRITGPLCRELTIHLWFPITNGQ